MTHFTRIGAMFSIGLRVLVFVLLSGIWVVTSAGEKNVRLSVCLPGPVDSLDPTDYRSRETQVVLKAMFDSLTTRDANMNVVPLLAESFKSLSDTLWEVRLKKGVCFHNGSLLTARDVRFTFDRVIRYGAIDGHTSARQSLFSPLTDIVVVDDYTVHFKTRTPWPILPLMLTVQEIVPETYMGKVGSADFETKPVGSGPFRFVEKKDSTLVLDRFKGYHAGIAPGFPVDGLVITIEPDVIRRIAMLKRGDADIITQVPPESLPMLEMNPDIRILARPASRSYFAELNCRKAPFDDRRVRVAMNYAMDMRMIVNTVIQGKGQALPTVLLPEAFSYDQTLNPYPYLPEKAIALLKEARFPTGYIMTICCEKNYESFASAIALFLSRIGIRSRIVIGEKQDMIDSMTSLTADMLVSSWGNTTLDPVGILLPIFKTGGRGNYGGYVNERVDELLSKAESMVNQNHRKDCYTEVQRLVYSDAPLIFGYAAEEFYAIRSRVEGFVPNMSGMLDFHPVSIEQRQKQ